MDFYRSLLFGLWKAKAFHQFLVGSVIPFVRINDFKKFVSEQAEHLQSKEPAFKKNILKVKALEQKERQMYEQLLLISELKRIYIAKHLKR
jgi:menaquinone-dependent protoporphyrinogen IX oxidase